MEFKNIGPKIEAARKLAGLSRTELARKIDSSYDQIRQWETGLRNPKIQSIQRIAQATDLADSFFLSENAGPEHVELYRIDEQLDGFYDEYIPGFDNCGLNEDNFWYVFDGFQNTGLSFNQILNMIVSEYVQKNPTFELPNMKR